MHLIYSLLFNGSAQTNGIRTLFCFSKADCKFSDNTYFIHWLCLALVEKFFIG